MGKRLRAGFYWRGGVIWRRTDAIDKVPRSTGATDPDAAYAWDAHRQRIRANPAYAASLTASFGGWVVKIIAIKKTQRAEGTVRMYREKLGHFVRIWGSDLPLANVDSGLVDSFIQQRREEGAANNTIARELTCLRQLLRHAKRAKEFPGDLSEIMPIGFAAEYVPVKRTLRLEDFPRLWEALRDDTERGFVALAIGLGADTGDIERMEPEYYDRERQVVRVPGTKTTTRDDEVPVLPHVRELVEFGFAQLPIRWADSSHGVGKACQRAGLSHLSPKDLRRTASSWLVASGADQRLVGRFLRHGSDAMVRKVYGQVTAEQLGGLLASSAESLQDSAGPLGEIGIRSGFKRRRTGETGGSEPGVSRSYETGGARGSTACSAGTLQRVAVEPLDALVLAARAVLARRVA
ncbi:MAG TPA: site-specific integrase [Polyangiaceae bacterium]